MTCKLPLDNCRCLDVEKRHTAQAEAYCGPRKARLHQDRGPAQTPSKPDPLQVREFLRGLHGIVAEDKAGHCEFYMTSRQYTV